MKIPTNMIFVRIRGCIRLKYNSLRGTLYVIFLDSHFLDQFGLAFLGGMLNIA